MMVSRMLSARRADCGTLAAARKTNGPVAKQELLKETLRDLWCFGNSCWTLVETSDQENRIGAKWDESMEGCGRQAEAKLPPGSRDHSSGAF